MSTKVKPTSPVGPGVVFEPTDFPDDSGGVGGWESIPRPRRASAAAWVGSPERTIALPLELNGIDGGGPLVDLSTTEQVRRVLSWGVKDKDTGQPPILQVIGVERVSPDDRWVLQDIAWGEFDRNDDGVLVRQALTLTLLRYVAPTLVKGPAKKIRDRKPKSSKGKGTKGHPGKKKRATK